MSPFIPHRKSRKSSQNSLTLFGKKRFHFILAALIFIGFAGSGLLSTAAPAAANAGLQNEARPQPAPTVTPSSNTSESKTGGSPLVGILVLLAPLAYMVWKSRGTKAPKITASACLPVIDESKRPFKIEEDEPAAKKPGAG